MKRLPLIFPMLSLFLLSGLAAQDIDWIPKKDHDGLKVYYRKPADSNVNEVRIETRLAAPLSAVIAVLKDVPAYGEWIYKCEEAKALEAPQPKASTYYCKIDFPWPLSNRDFIARSRLTQDPDTRTVFIDVTGAPDYLPKNKGTVRIETLQIHYELTPLPNGQVDMIYELKSEPGGALPAWLVNLAIDKGPTETILGMRRMLNQEKYLSERYPFLD